MMIVTKFLAFLLPSSHSERKCIAERPSLKPRSDRVLSQAPWTAADSGGLHEATAGPYPPASSGRVRRGTLAPSYVPNFTAYGGTCLKYEGDFACCANNQNPPTTVPIPPDRMEPSSIKQR